MSASQTLQQAYAPNSHDEVKIREEYAFENGCFHLYTLTNFNSIKCKMADYCPLFTICLISGKASEIPSPVL